MNTPISNKRDLIGLVNWPRLDKLLIQITVEPFLSTTGPCLCPLSIKTTLTTVQKWSQRKLDCTSFVMAALTPHFTCHLSTSIFSQYDEAADIALQQKSDDEFNFILSKIPAANRALHDKITAMRAQLGGKR